MKVDWQEQDEVWCICIVWVVFELFVCIGFDSVSVQDIVCVVFVSCINLYCYFFSKMYMLFVYFECMVGEMCVEVLWCLSSGVNLQVVW